MPPEFPRSPHVGSLVSGNNPSRQLVNRGHMFLYNLKTVDEPEVNFRIQSLRDLLDEVDKEIVHALNERARLVKELATVKGEAGAPLYDPQREEEILQQIARENPGPIYDSTMREIFELIMHHIRDIEVQP